MEGWMGNGGAEGDVVISSRVRLARNFEGYPFPMMLKRDDAASVRKLIFNALLPEYTGKALDEISPIERLILVEKHMISPDLLARADTGAYAVNGDKTMSVMMLEEDHARIQCLLPGFALPAAAEAAQKADERLGSAAPYCYDKTLGYLTSCPTNVGTGMRASLMLHLPALTMVGHMQGILQSVGKVGLTVRGIYGEGTEALGDLYQISNQITLGVSEGDTLRALSGTTMQIIELERAARRDLCNHVELEDKLYRAYGTLRYARRIDSKEFMANWSMARWAMEMGWVDRPRAISMTGLMVSAQSACLQQAAHKELSAEERDGRRAAFVREALSCGANTANT